MILLLILADDFTGALDTGVQFAACGISTRVIVGEVTDFSAYQADVLVVDTETRHLPPDTAACVVARLTKNALEAGIRFLYKKTDSALRGNVGAELAALFQASHSRQLPFLPAFPQIGRVTRNGIHYIDGVPVAESPFGNDPFEPVCHSAVTALLARQTSLPSHSYPVLHEGDAMPKEEGILVFDAATTEDLAETGRRLFSSEPPRILAGCAGFGAMLPKLLNLTGQPVSSPPPLIPRLLVICGSVNPITLAQLDEAKRRGFSRLCLTPRQKLEPDYWQSNEGKESLTKMKAMLEENPCCIIESNDPDGNEPTAQYAKKLGIDKETMRVRISSSLGHIFGALFAGPWTGTLLVTGGDTLLQCMNHVGVWELEPVREMENGVVLARFTYNGRACHVITKSGGFGQPDLLVRLANRIVNC